MDLPNMYTKCGPAKKFLCRLRGQLPRLHLLHGYATGVGAAVGGFCLHLFFNHKRSIKQQK